RSKTVRAIQEVLLVDGLQHVAQRTLYDLVLDRRYADRSSPAVVLRDVNPANWLVTVLPRLHPYSQCLQVHREPFAVLTDRHGIDAHGRVAAQVPIRTFERCLVNEVSQREDPLFRMSFRSLRYPHESW